MADDRAFDDAVCTSRPASPMPLSSNVGSPNGSLPDLEETGIDPTTMEETSTKYSYKSRSCRYSCRACRRFPRLWPRMMQKFRILNKLKAVLQPALPPCHRQKPAGVERVNRWTRNAAQRCEDYYYDALAFSRHNINLVFEERLTSQVSCCIVCFHSCAS